MANQKDYPYLGEAVSEVIREMEIDPIDERIAAWGDCTGLLWKGIERNCDRIAQRHGFKNSAHLFDVVAERTSMRYVYFHLPRFS